MMDDVKHHIPLLTNKPRFDITGNFKCQKQDLVVGGKNRKMIL